MACAVDTAACPPPAACTAGARPGHHRPRKLGNALQSSPQTPGAVIGVDVGRKRDKKDRDRMAQAWAMPMARQGHASDVWLDDDQRHYRALAAWPLDGDQAGGLQIT